MSKNFLAIQADPIETININTDTTFLLALEAQKRFSKIYWYETKDLSFVKGKVYAEAKEVIFFQNKKKYFKVLKNTKVDLSKVKFILIRQNPPFNMDYITSTLYLEFLTNKVKVLNDPKAIRNISEKLFSINLTNLMPPTIFTRSIDEIKSFYFKYRQIVIKPINGYGGNNILYIKRFNKKLIQNYLNKSEHVMVQKFLPSIKDGDKRVFIINGKVKGAIRRVPKKNSILSNIGQGGTAFKTKLNNKEKKISNVVARKLKKANIYFAGIDLISNKLIGGKPVIHVLGEKNPDKSFKKIEPSLEDVFFTNIQK